jgi:hypothetical protein
MKKHFFIVLAIIAISSWVNAQNDIHQQEVFFKSRAKDFERWIDNNQLGNYFLVDRLNVDSNQVTITLLSKFEGEKSGDSLRSVWKGLRRQFYIENKKELHEAMLNKLAFQMDLPIDSTQILIKSKSSKY